MEAKEIFEARKRLQSNMEKVVNFLTGEYTPAKQEYDRQMAELQRQCPHMWDTGENAIVNFTKHSLCSICQKKFKN